jgi:hypothetical protein
MQCIKRIFTALSGTEAQPENQRNLERVLADLQRKLAAHGLVVPGTLMEFLRDLRADSRIPPALARQLARTNFGNCAEPPRRQSVGGLI